MGVADPNSVTVGHLGRRGGAGAYASTPLFVTGPRYIIVDDEEWFDSCDDARKRFIIGHEATHLCKRHEIKMGTLVLSAGLLACAMDRVLSGQSTTQGLLLRGAALGGSALLATLGAACFSRKIEREADEHGARVLRAAAGGVVDMEDLRGGSDETIVYAFGSNWEALKNRVMRACLRPFRTHPTHTERIAYLGELARMQS